MTKRLNNGRERDTRQITLKALSIVNIIHIAVMARKLIPTAVSRAALSVNCCMYLVIFFPPVSGIKLLNKNVLIWVEKSAKTGKAENKVSAMVIRGTSDNNVVKVRLAAICEQRS